MNSAVLFIIGGGCTLAFMLIAHAMEQPWREVDRQKRIRAARDRHPIPAVFRRRT